MNIYDQEQKWQRCENESLNGAASFGGGLFSESTCDPIVRLSHASPHQTRSQLKCSSPACQSAKTKYINSGKQISSVTFIWLQKNGFLRRRYSRCSLCSAGRHQANFFTLQKTKKQKQNFVSAIDKILHRALPSQVCVFVPFSNKLFSTFHQPVFRRATRELRLHITTMQGFISRFPSEETRRQTDASRLDFSARPQTLLRVESTRARVCLFL